MAGISSMARRQGISAESLFPKPEFKVIAAVDLGTKYSGYAFQLKADDKIVVNTKWNKSVLPYKTPTSVLFKANGEFAAFGQEAISTYVELEPEEAEEYLFFDNFKMFLYDAMENNKQLDGNSMLGAACGRQMPALKVFAAALSYLKKHLVDNVVSASRLTLEYEDVLWVLTTPAIWNDAAKNFMREAAYEAELIKRDDSDRLMIALEPEAAALHCRKVPLAKECEETEIGECQPGDKYMVIDCGGGTVDITVHEMLMDKDVREIHKATGGPHGGEQVDKKFVSLLADIFDEEILSKFRTENASIFQEIIHNFETQKRACNFSGEDRMNVSLTVDFTDMYKDETGESAADIIKSFNENRGMNLSLRRKHLLSIPQEDVEKLYDEVITNIIDVSLTLMEHDSVKDVRTVFLVGGFAECALVQKRVREAFKAKHEDSRVMVPHDAGFAVLKGAIMFAENPAVIKERVMRKTYGVPVVLPWDSNKYSDVSKKLEVDGRFYCKDVFFQYVKAGTRISVGHVVQHAFSPFEKDATSFCAKVCASSKEFVLHSDDEGCDMVGKVEVQLPPGIGSGQRPCNVYFFFGGTEIKVVAVDNATSTRAETRISFMSGGAATQQSGSQGSQQSGSQQSGSQSSQTPDDQSPQTSDSQSSTP